MTHSARRRSRRAYYSATQRQSHIERGLCRDCTDPAEPGKRSCKRHLAWATQRKRNWRNRLKELVANDSRFAIYSGNETWVADYIDNHSDDEVPF